MPQSLSPADLAKLMLPFKAVQIVALDGNGQSIASPTGAPTSSGFVRREAQGLFLYTAWSVVAGHHPHAIEAPPASQRPASLQVTLQTVEEPGLGVQHFGRARAVNVPLYHAELNTPVWFQDGTVLTAARSSSAAPRLPTRHNAVKLPIPAERISPHQIIDGDAAVTSMVLPGDRVLIVGYQCFGKPSAIDPGMPVVLTRFVASRRTGEARYNFLLDGSLPDSFCGAPVFVAHDSTIECIGLCESPQRAAEPASPSEPFHKCCDLTLAWDQPEEFGLAPEHAGSDLHRRH